jgi:hypothetical protein
MIIGTPSEAATVLAPLFAPAECELIAVIHLDRDHRLLAIVLEKEAAPMRSNCLSVRS